MRPFFTIGDPQQHMAAIVESSDDAIIGKDLEGTITSWNRGAERLYGYSAEEIIGRSIATLVPPEQADEIPAILDRLKRGERIEHYETVRVRKDGTRIEVSVTISPIRDVDGRIAGASAIARDISANKRSERERVLSLERERAARAAAEEANRVKDEFLATVSHELRTPLNAILGWTEMARAGVLGPERLGEALTTIERNAKLQAQLVDDLLDISRIVTGRLKLEAMQVNLRDVIGAAIETVRPAADARSITLRVDDDREPALVTGDPARLQQVVWNLLSNAVKFTPKHGTVTTALRRVGSEVEIAVSDTGIGISAEFLPHMFDAFRQADPGPTRRHGGLGLGLAIVRRITEMHGGRVEADSAGVGAGATFAVRLPVRAVEEQRGVSSGAESQVVRELRGLDILVVDDDPDSRRLVALLLEEVGANVRTAESAEAALAEFNNRVPDLLIADVGMPERDGTWLIDSIRNHAAGRTVPALGLTAYVNPHEPSRLLNAGFDAHMAKPVSPRELLRVLAVLRTSRQPDADLPA